MEKDKVIFEESLSDEWAGDLEVAEVPLNEKPLFYVGFLAIAIGIVVVGRLLYLDLVRGAFYVERAEANLFDTRSIPAPRGIVTDRRGTVLAENVPTFSVFLNVKEFLERPELRDPTLSAIRDILNVPAGDIWRLVEETDLERLGGEVLLTSELSQSQLVALKGVKFPTIELADGFKREYSYGTALSSVVGYTGLPGPGDLRRDPRLSTHDLIGRSGIEAFYDAELRGENGVISRIRDARGRPLGGEERRESRIGTSLTLTVDAEFQRYFSGRFAEGLAALGRTSGVGLAVNPQNGEVLALMSFPAFDGNVLGASGRNEEKQRILQSTLRPLFNRAVSGMYTPGSTIKPLVGVAALKEEVIDPKKTIFSPGYLDVPNPYDPERPTRYLDWRYQGDVDLSAAIAQSSNVYFYTVGGGTSDAGGLGISRLHEWWQRFRFGDLTGVDLPGEARGFLPTADWKEKSTGRPWLLGDTYNVSIGQGDLLVTPVQLLGYVSAIANGGRIYQPFVNAKLSQSPARADLSELVPQIREVQKGMREAVTSPLGTAHLLVDLPFSVGAKTGSAQVRNNEEENAFFVGYAPFDDPQIAILVLVENSREGSLNAVPIAKDVLNWYYWNRIRR